MNYPEFKKVRDTLSILLSTYGEDLGNGTLAPEDQKSVLMGLEHALGKYDEEIKPLTPDHLKEWGFNSGMDFGEDPSMGEFVQLGG